MDWCGGTPPGAVWRRERREGPWEGGLEEEEEEAGRGDRSSVVPELAELGEAAEEEEEEDVCRDNHQQAAAPKPAEATAVRARARWLEVYEVEDMEDMPADDAPRKAPYIFNSFHKPFS